MGPDCAGGLHAMIVRQWETELEENAAEAVRTPRLRSEPSPIGQLLGQNLLDDAVRALQEDLAMLQAGQERGLDSLGGALAQIGQEIGAVRAQLAVLAEPIMKAQAAEPGAEVETER